MEDFERRTRASFDSLGVTGTDPEGTEKQWMPTSSPIYRNGYRDVSSDDEEEERRRRTSVGGIHMDLGDDEFDTALGVRPSIAFSSQIDREEESDIMDIQSLQFDDAEGVSPVVPRAGGQEEWRQSSGEKRPVRSALKKKDSYGEDVPVMGKKKVSFTGIPEPKKPYVPPHKRAAAPESEDAGSTVPDYVKNPDRYTMYEFDEPVIVGGGVQQFEMTSRATTTGKGDEDGHVTKTDENNNGDDSCPEKDEMREKPVYNPGRDSKKKGCKETNGAKSEQHSHVMSFDAND